MAKRLFIIDGMAMLFRSFFAFSRNPLTTTDGAPVGAILGSAMFMHKLITEERPDYLMAVKDGPGPTFRHEAYEAYKANRDAMPSELVAQLPLFEELMQGFKAPLFYVKGFEADDVIGTLAKRFASDELEVYIVSGDKDFMQLLSPGVFMYTPKKAEQAIVIGEADVYERFGCKPEQFIDVLAIMGDTADNVPGVKGIGEKGASKLVSTYGSLENIYEHLDDISGKKQKEVLGQYKDEAFLSRDLVTIRLDVPVEAELDNYAIEDVRESAASKELVDFYQRLEFRQLVERAKNLQGGSNAAPVASTPILSTNDFRLIDNATSLDQMVQAVNSTQHLSYFILPTRDDLATAKVAGIAIASSEENLWYLPYNALSKALEEDSVRNTMNAVLTDPQITKIGLDIKQDWHLLRKSGLEVEAPFFDLHIADYLLDPNHHNHELGMITSKHLGIEKEQLPTGSRPVDLCAKVGLMHAASSVLRDKLEASEMMRVMNEVESPLIKVLAEMEAVGVHLDTNRLALFSERLQTMLVGLQAQIYEQAGEEFNIQSPKQLQVVLFEKLKIHEELKVKRLKKSKSGYSTDESVLQKLSAHPLPDLILKYREVAKLKNTYVDPLPQLLSAETSRLHTRFRQTIAATGRLSSDNPNLQNIPLRSELGREIRQSFRPDSPDYVYLSADYSQVEIRLLAHLAEAEHLIKAFREGLDIHRITAADIFQKDPDEVDSTLRSRAKAINFGILYGMGPQRLAQQTGVSMAEAKDFIERYFATYPGIKKFTDSLIDVARKTGYSTTMLGRKRPIEGIADDNRMILARAENMAVNSPIQGSAADLIKLAMIRVAERLKTSELRAQMILQVHDELVFECHHDDVDGLQVLVREGMEHAMEAKVPFSVDIGFGEDWLQAH